MTNPKSYLIPGLEYEYQQALIRLGRATINLDKDNNYREVLIYNECIKKAIRLKCKLIEIKGNDTL